jgi:hypothetical protein
MIKKIILFLAFTLSVWSQTTTITANTSIIDRQGNLLTGSLCLGLILFNSTVPCQPIASGVMATYTVPNATYAIWLNSGTTPIFTISGIVFNGTPVATDTYLSGQFAVLVGTNYVFPSVQTPVMGLTCSGNAIALMGNPQQNQTVSISNQSATTACTITGNGNSIFYQGASASPQSLAAHSSWIGTYIVNYDQLGLGHNAWIVSHLGT